MNYYSTRYKLFINSYFASELAKALRYKYLGTEKIFNEGSWRKGMPEIIDIANNLDLNYKDFALFIFFNRIVPNPSPPTRLFIAPITTEGFYIKITENMTDLEILTYAHKAQEIMNSHEEGKRKIAGGNTRKQIGIKDKEKTIYFLEIESKVKELANEKKGNLKNYEKYGGLIGIAISVIAEKEIIEKFADTIYPDEKLDKLIANKKIQLRTWYDEIIRRYNLLSPRKLKPFLEALSTRTLPIKNNEFEI